MNQCLLCTWCKSREASIQRGIWEVVVTCEADHRKWQLLKVRLFSRSPSMSSSSSGQRFADYFVVSGLDLVTGLEADQLSGLWDFSMRFNLVVTMCGCLQKRLHVGRCDLLFFSFGSVKFYSSSTICEQLTKSALKKFLRDYTSMFSGVLLTQWEYSRMFLSLCFVPSYCEVSVNNSSISGVYIRLVSAVNGQIEFCFIFHIITPWI